jgi:DNA topoisomerase IB
VPPQNDDVWVTLKDVGQVQVIGANSHTPDPS